MKAVFVIRQGALVEGVDARCTLRCGAGAGLRMLLDLDLRLVVIEGAAGNKGAAGDQSARLSGRLPDNGRRRRRGDPAAAMAGGARLDHGDRSAPLAASWSIQYTLPDGPSGRWRRIDAAAADESLRAPAGCWHTAEDNGGSDDLAIPEDGFDNNNKGGSMFAREERVGATAGGTCRADMRPDQPPAGDGPARLPRVPPVPPVPRAGAGGDDELAGSPAHSRAPAGGPFRIDRLGDLLFREQLALTAYYCCSHGDGVRQVGDPAPACFCLPPQPGLLLQAAYEHGIDLHASWMIGATLDDIEAGNRAGCRTILIDNGTETSWRLGRARVPTRIAPDLHGAALLIFDEGERMRP